MTYKNGGRSGLLDTISTLRLCNELQSEVIANMEQYQTSSSAPESRIRVREGNTAIRPSFPTCTNGKMRSIR